MLKAERDEARKAAFILQTERDALDGKLSGACKTIKELVLERDKLRAALETMCRGWKFGNLSEADFIEACRLSNADLRLEKSK